MSKRKPAKKTPIPLALIKAFVAAAQDLYQEEGEVEIDVPDSASHADWQKQISTAETIEGLVENGGAYVKAWVWVDLDSAQVFTKPTDTDVVK